VSTASGRVYTPLLPWGDFHTRRWFCLTADQDWAPEWAMEFFMAWVRGLEIPLHVFTTNESRALAESAGRDGTTVGWHPNFGTPSSHGATPRDVVSHMQGLAPKARTFRTHGFAESYQALAALAEAGHRVESQFPTRFSAGITPLLHATGLVRLPVWFEDDIWMREPVDADRRIEASIDSPGLKILNLHPIHIALNSPNYAYYNAHRDEIYTEGTSVDDLAYTGRGARTIAEQIISVAGRDETFVAFPELAAYAWDLSQSAEPTTR
jgi:hypothetical protein